jgi:hypothetical protein
MQYLQPRDGPVIDGRESEEVVFAKDQPEYIPLRCLVGIGVDRRVTSRWTLTPKQRQMVLDGADIYLTLLTYGQPLQPILMGIE